MKVKFVIDADLPRALFQGLIRRSSKLDVVRVHQIGLASATDAEILDFAARDGRITVSRDKATMWDVAADRVQRGESMPGLLLVRPDYVRRHGFGLRQVIDDLVLIAECTDAEEWLNLIQFLPLSE